MKTDDADTIKMRMAERLRAARLAVGLSQEQVGEMFGLGKGTVSAWETGRSDPGAVKLVQLCAIYGTTPDQVLLPDASRRRGAH